MFGRKKYFIICCVLVVFVGMICLAAGYAWAKDTGTMKKSDWQGTFQIGEHKLDNGEYIAVTPSFENDAENAGKFQWYNENVLHEGTYQITDQNYLTLYENQTPIAVIFAKNHTYYFADQSLEVQKLVRTAKEPNVLKPMK